MGAARLTREELLAELAKVPRGASMSMTPEALAILQGVREPDIGMIEPEWDEFDDRAEQAADEASHARRFE